MKVYQLKWEQPMPISLDEAWKFFSSPLNLEKITPPEMKFDVTSKLIDTTKMYEGMIITYKVAPLMKIKINWVTEITHVKDHEYFIDEQRFGPYKFWHHEHHFREIQGGVNMTDILTYAISFGPIGTLANKILVTKKINDIFKFREKAVNDLFGVYKGPLKI